MADSWFLWPEPKLRRGWRALRSTPAAVESLLAARFPSQGEPVLVSSGRVAIVLALEALGVTRADAVALFPYASHCVIESVGRVGTPAPEAAATSARFGIVFHQWGFVQGQVARRDVIEDAADSFCVSGVKLFPAGGDFEVWSLPKLMGSLGGGVLWCRHGHDADQLRALRDGKNALTTFRWILRAASSRGMHQLVPFWYGAESAGGAPPGWGCADIHEGMQRWDEISLARASRLNLVGRFLPEWLTPTPMRFPTAIPVMATDRQAAALATLGFSAGWRHFERAVDRETRELPRVFPVPIHQDVPLDRLHRVAEILERQV